MWSIEEKSVMRGPTYDVTKSCKVQDSGEKGRKNMAARGKSCVLHFHLMVQDESLLSLSLFSRYQASDPWSDPRYTSILPRLHRHGSTQFRTPDIQCRSATAQAPKPVLYIRCEPKRKKQIQVVLVECLRALVRKELLGLGVVPICAQPAKIGGILAFTS